MSQGNVFLSRDIHWHRVGDVQNSRPGLNNQSLSKAYSVPYGRVYFTSRTISVVYNVFKNSIKKGENEGKFYGIYFGRLHRRIYEQARNNYASLTHQITDRGPFLESPDN